MHNANDNLNPLPNPAQLRALARPAPDVLPCLPGSHCERHTRGLGGCIAGECNPPAALGVKAYVRPQECAASGAGHNDGPHGPRGEVQCAYCGQSPSAGVRGCLTCKHRNTEPTAFTGNPCQGCGREPDFANWEPAR